MKKYLTYILSFLFLFAAPCVWAEDPAGDDASGVVATIEERAEALADAEEEAFNPKEAIFEHLLDAYGWELPFSHTHRIPLPVIVRDYKGDWSLFSSSRIGHGQSYNGFYVAEEGPNKGKIESVDADGNKYRPMDFSITKNVLALIISALVCLFCIFSVARHFKKDGYKASRKGVGAVEFVIEYIYNGVIKSTLGDKAPKFAPYLLTIFFFILVMNLLGLIVIFPGGANLTGNISVTFVLALCTFIVVNVTGTKEYWKEIFWPDVPTWLKFPLPIMPLIEVFGVFTKPAALMIRLFANMMGGHMIVLALTSLIFIFGALGAAVMGATTVVSVVFSLFMLLLDTLVSFIQAYVFTMLSTLFISLSQVKGHH